MTKTRQNKLNIIVGLGQTGYACVDYFIRKGESVQVIDTRENPPMLAQLKADFPAVKIHLGSLDEQLLASADQVVLSPGVSIYRPEIVKIKQQGVPVVGDIELFAQEVTVPVVAITGSNAKSTVTQLVGDMAIESGKKVHVGGNIGTPVLDMLKFEQPDFYVLEISSFQLETVESLKPKVATVLNLSHDHLDRHGNFEEYKTIKHKIYRNSENILFNRTDKNTVPEKTSANLMSFGLDKAKTKGNVTEFGLTKKDKVVWLTQGKDLLLPSDSICRNERHDLENALAAIAIGQTMGLNAEAMYRVLVSFKGLPHRCEWVGRQQGVTWINDSKGTNVGATMAALKSFSDEERSEFKMFTRNKPKTVLIAGGEAKDGNFKVLCPIVQRSVRAMILLGRDRVLIGKALAGSAPIFFVNSLKEAVLVANQMAKSGDKVLLSPACSSFDMFESYAKRGEEFKALVHAEILGASKTREQTKEQAA